MGRASTALVVLTASALCLAWLPHVVAHGGDHEVLGMGMDTTMDMHSEHSNTTITEPSNYPPTYFALADHRTLLLTHIALMVIAWVVTLPLATVLSLARSRYTILLQLIFTALNAVGVFFSIAYNVNTPDLYPGNAHHKLGWLVTWVLGAQVAVSALGGLAGLFDRSRRQSKSSEYAGRPLMAVSQANMEEHHRAHDHLHDFGFSRDSGQGTERNTESLRSDSLGSIEEGLPSPKREQSDDGYGDENDDGLDSGLHPAKEKGKLHGFAQELGRRMSSRVWKVLKLAYDFTDRTSMILGYITLTTGIITYARFFEGHQIFTGLAHWIKGSIFFWFGILTLGRWAGSFGDLGWAWNVRPTSTSRRWRPSAEFVESFLIFFYGSTNIFLEHLGSTDEGWSAQDLEHMSITVLFIGGGLCGMLIESAIIRDLLNTKILLTTSEDVHDAETAEESEEPRSYRFSMNPIPALVILLLGIMMSSHQQTNMTSSMLHKQWGNLLTGASFARGFTYVLTYLKPPKSVLPSRPPTELLTAFGLMAGGIMFMASSGDTVDGMIHYGLDAMLVYTVAMGFTALLMAWQIAVLAVKGWAVRKEKGLPLGRRHYRSA